MKKMWTIHLEAFGRCKQRSFKLLRMKISLKITSTTYSCCNLRQCKMMRDRKFQRFGKKKLTHFQTVTTWLWRGLTCLENVWKETKSLKKSTQTLSTHIFRMAMQVNAVKRKHLMCQSKHCTYYIILYSIRTNQRSSECFLIQLLNIRITA